MFDVILWDVDGTLLDFPAAERQSLLDAFAHFDLGPCPEDRVARYSKLNASYWKRLERGEITKNELLPGRFQEFFQQEGIHFDRYWDFNDFYQLRLGENATPQDDSWALVASLRGRVKQYAVTNGTKVAQDIKLDRSGLAELLDGIFISEVVGAEKPDPAFFAPVFQAMGPVDKGRVLMVGDSLTSDMQGANNVGIPCCWYDPKDKPLPDHLRIDFHISHLSQVVEILKGTL
ncbi:MAG: YjjG family noncanonical pyrimidine nucleotidase [Ruminiclostridium sp.]|nr:YjjG family noncanonical pyrimidine nucleotidase [Ruminiclostridium sp.]